VDVGVEGDQSIDDGILTFVFHFVIILLSEFEFHSMKTKGFQSDSLPHLST
jgi:hypothetical protein